MRIALFAFFIGVFADYTEYLKGSPLDLEDLAHPDINLRDLITMIRVMKFWNEFWFLI